MASHCRYIESVQVSSTCHRVYLCASEGNVEGVGGDRDQTLMGPESEQDTAELKAQESTNVY